MRAALVLLALVPSLAMAQGGGSQQLAAPPEGTRDAEAAQSVQTSTPPSEQSSANVSSAEEIPPAPPAPSPANIPRAPSAQAIPIPPAPAAPNAQPVQRSRPLYMSPLTARERAYVERLQRRMQRREMVLQQREQRRQQMRVLRDRRLTNPWSFRLEAFWTATPRSINGFGPYDGNDGYAAYFGGGAGLTGSRWLTRAVRADLRVALGYIAGDGFLNGDHGAESSLGLAVSVHTAGTRRLGIGLGVDAVLAREYDAATEGHFRWLGLRGVLVGEMAFVGRHGNAFVMKVSPTLTWAPWADHPFPGIISGIGVEWSP